jgi:uncharacterized membrane protein
MSYGHGDRHDDLTGRLEPNRAGNGSWNPDAEDDEFSPGWWSRDRDTRAGGRREGRAARRRDPIRRLLTGLVVVIAVVQVAAMVLLWPRGPVPMPVGATNVYAGVTFFHGQVRQVAHTTCAGDTDNRLPDGSIPATMTCTTASVQVDSGPDAGRVVKVGISPQQARSGLAVGVAVQLIRYPAVPGTAPVYAFLDFSRELPLTVLAICFAALVVLVARLRGLLALVGLLLAYATIAVFVLPALHHGENPLLVAAIGAGSIMMVILYLAHGFSAKTTIALLGTLAGVWLSAGLADWVSGAAHLNGLGSEENYTLSRLTGGSDLSGVVLAGIVLAGLGVLNDVTITQASAVWELHEQAPHLTRRGLFSSGMRIGRDHLASTVYTIAFAYAGVALPTLLLVDLYGEPLRQLLSSNEVGEEIARTLVASIGLILSIPLTTAIAVLVAHGSPGDRPAHHDHSGAAGMNNIAPAPTALDDAAISTILDVLDGPLLPPVQAQPTAGRRARHVTPHRGT